MLCGQLDLCKEPIPCIKSELAYSFVVFSILHHSGICKHEASTQST